MTYRQAVNKPAARLYRDPEDIRRHNENLKNIERLIRYNNKRTARGLAQVSYPPALIAY